jgi:nitrate/TMAO reductase-like tetraheme cytochrome c subunit
MRTLSLKRETLAELSNEELDQVVGASGLTCFACHNSDFMECITGLNCLSVGGC